MVRYLARRFCYSLVALFIIVTATFFLMKAVPGDPFAQEKAIPKEILDALKAHYHLDEPWYIQYGYYLKGVVTWDLGPSFKYKARTVNEIIAQGFPVSAALGAEALVLAIAMGVLLGSIAASFYRRWPDYLAMAAAVIGISVPSFILAAFLQYLFSIKLSLLPVARWGTFEQSILPALALAALPTAFIARLTRSSMLEALEQDYIKTAASKGLSTAAVVIRHGLRNALLPVVAYLGILTANVLTGVFIIEKIFGIPGLGQWFVNSITNRDYTVIMGVTVFYAALLLAAIFVVDLLYGLIDPRIQLTGKKR